MHFVNKSFLIVFMLILISIGLFALGVKKIGPDQNNYQLPITNYQTAPRQSSTTNINNSQPEISSSNLAETSSAPEIKTQVNLAVPFTPQAPFAVWDDLHNEACEEASLLMVHYYLTGKTFTSQIADQEIIKLVDWQKKNWGGHYDLSLENLAKLAREYFGYQKIRTPDKSGNLVFGNEENYIPKIKILTDPDFEEIKKELSNGNPIIAPMAGRLLKNPYYRQPGPYYHMLVIRGYQNDEIITNDAGTRRGQDFRYQKEVFFNALHDWPGPLGSTKDDVDILKGRKAILIIER